MHQVEERTSEKRKQLAWLVMRLFKHWRADCETKLNLLGLSYNSRGLLKQFEEGSRALPNSRDVLDRVKLLLDIHQNLRILYPESDELCHNWIYTASERLAQSIPIELMKKEGLVGIAKVAHVLNHLRTM